MFISDYVEVKPVTALAFHTCFFFFFYFDTHVNCNLVMSLGKVLYMPGFSLFLLQEWRKRRIMLLKMVEKRTIKVRFFSCYVKFSHNKFRLAVQLG